MEMPMPDNTLPMMTGFGQFGPIEMGGMFSVVKVREGLARDDYKDPGWYKHPAGTVAYEFKGAAAASAAAPGAAAPAQRRDRSHGRQAAHEWPRPLKQRHGQRSTEHDEIDSDRRKRRAVLTLRRWSPPPPMRANTFRPASPAIRRSRRAPSPSS